MNGSKELKSLTWDGTRLTLIDQTLLPGREEYIVCTDYRRVAEAIRRLQVRGAPAIGAAAAFGLVLGAVELLREQKNLVAELPRIALELKSTRPTAVNLAWALDRMLCKLLKSEDTCSELNLSLLVKEACLIASEDQSVNEMISKFGAELFSKPMSVLTHCNAGALATVAVGTALGVIGQAWKDGNVIRVFAGETRPLLQGARLTALELSRSGIPVTLITDNMAGWVMKSGKVQIVIVGADRIAANGDTANKIGTYSLAVLANAHNIPFYIAAPLSTFDPSIASGEDIPIVERHADEVFSFCGVKSAPDGIDAFNPAFDVTPAELISGIISERGILRSPYKQAIEQIFNSKGGKS